MHYSDSIVMLQNTFLHLRNGGYLIEGRYYKESRNNLLKDYLRSEYGWRRTDVNKAIKSWRKQGFIKLEFDRLIFLFTTPITRKNIPIITDIE